MTQTRPLLLSPAGSFASLTAALNSGADAVYFGTTLLNMRAAASNFELNQLPEVARCAHGAGAKAYLTLNVQVYDHELETVEKVLLRAKEAGVDAVIAWDMAVVQRAREIGLPFHMSTQASIANVETALFYESLGAKTLVLARECSLNQIEAMTAELRRRGSELKIEIFAHGAMCVAISGRCFLSQHAFGKSGNRGECMQPCRRSYRIIDKEGELEFGVEASTLLSPRDLCTIPLIPRLVSSGVNLLKLEGRNRSPDYVATVTRTYRDALDRAILGNYSASDMERDMETLSAVYNKKFHTGFYDAPPTGEHFTEVENSAATHKKKYLGVITRVYGKIQVFDLELHTGTLEMGQKVMIIGPRTGVHQGEVVSIFNGAGEPVSNLTRG
ncbi:U32 family peptidase, partial [Myxococcota bacterium]|nr:U32 family peptidase [Myxococcota bacterium]